MTDAKDNESEQNVVMFPGYKDMETFVQEGFKCLVNGTKNSNKLPSGKSRDFYEACPSFFAIMKTQGDAVLQQLSRVIQHAGIKGNIQRRDEEERYEMIVDANDAIFERVGTLLDEIAGIRRNPDAEFIANSAKAISGSWNRRNLARDTVKVKTFSSIMNATKNLEKPQMLFDDKPNNNRDEPFVPKIKYKHNMLKPLALLFEDDGEVGQYSHPYEFEIEKFTPDNDMLVTVDPIPFRQLEETELTFIKTADQIQGMLDHLKESRIIAVDLEHHSYRSFQGITCLMQISTREKDFIIDTIALRNELESLNEVFTNPKIIKVFHGAQSDIQWLQRDLALYIVNLFDTHIAARHLNYPSLSLAYLLDRFCNVRAQKQFQLADWRVRPIPDEMLMYAREDTHYLLYIHDLMKNALLEKANGQDNLLKSVIMESNLLCLTRYVKPSWRSDDYLNLYHKSKRLLDNRQLFALQQLFDWRDKTARECDESIGYVLPNHMLLHIAESLPREVQGILACCNPVPPLVRQNLTPLHYIIRKAREQPLVRPVVDQVTQVDRGEVYGLSVDSPLRCPHDLTWLPEFRSDLPVLLTNEGDDRTDNVCVSRKEPIITVFEGKKVYTKKKNINLLTPFERYKLVKPFADQLAKDVTKEMEENKQTIQKMEIDKIQSLLKEEPEEEKPLREQVEKDKSKSKRKSDSKIENKKNKKMKADPEMVPNPFHSITSTEPDTDVIVEPNPSEVPPKEKKKKLKTSECKESFDYGNVDFAKFQSNSADKVTHKPMKFKNKHKKMGKKKFKVSI